MGSGPSAEQQRDALFSAISSAEAPKSASMDALTETILRRIMRAACVLGSLGILLVVMSPHPFNHAALGLAVGATVLIFGMTFAPLRVRWLSIFYPWALVIVGGVLNAMTGPRPDAMLLVAGGLFIGSLVLQLRGLLVLSAATLSGYLWCMLAAKSSSPQLVEGWNSAMRAMVAVVVPASIAGRMILGALAGALDERGALVSKLESERRALERTVETLEATRSQLTHAQKLELVSQMAGGIAHDMNNALTVVIGEASLLNNSVTEQRERIVEAGGHAAKLTRQLMLFGRRDTLRPQSIDLTLTLTSVAQSVRRMLPSDIEMQVDVPSHSIAIFADPTQIFQIVLNLAGNSRDAMASGGRLRLSLNEVDDHAKITVADTGEGMAPELIEKVFEPFFTTKPAGRGTGLGLSNVKQLMESMNGQLELRSQRGVGTTFELLIPMTKEPVAPEREPLNESEARTAHILVVDDDVRVRAVAFSSLERLGYQMREASGVKSAVALLSQRELKLDLVITDVVMPDGGGAELIRQVRALRPEVRVLVMSGYAGDEALRRGISAGEVPFVAKPFTAKALARATEAALRENIRSEL